MTIQLMGYEPVDYENKAGKRVQGVKVYGIDLTTESDRIIGHPTFEEFISIPKDTAFDLGERYAVEFEQYRFKGRYETKVSGLRKEK